MYQTILVPLDTTSADRTIVAHVVELAKAHASRVIIFHVLDGWAAQTYGSDAVSPEVAEDKAYLEKVRRIFVDAGIEAEAQVAFGNPASEIIRWIGEHHCDLIAMSTHGHRLIGDLLHGTTAHRVQHHVDVPVLLLKVKGG